METLNKISILSLSAVLMLAVVVTADARELINEQIAKTVVVDKKITYQGFNKRKHTYTINLILLTLFNHQTHHRGQIHNMLSQIGIKPPQIDIPDFI